MRRVLTGAIALSLTGGAAITALAIWPIGRQSAQIELAGDAQRGAYLARASGSIACHTNFETGGTRLAGGAVHCGAWHTGRNLAGGRVAGAVFSGNDALSGGNKAPSILPSNLRDRGWTVSNLSYALRSGITPTGDVFGGSMGEVVQNGTQFLSKVDLRAMTTYLLDNDVAEEGTFPTLPGPKPKFD